MAAVVTVGEARDLSEPWLRLLLGGPSPWVLAAVGEEDFIDADADTALVDGVGPGLWSLVHLHTWEGPFAHSWPVWKVKVLGAHWVLLAWGLEPAVFRAVLVSPWSSRTVHIDSGVGNGEGVIVWSTHASIFPVRDHCLYNLLLGRAFESFKCFAELGSSTVLNALDEDVGVVEHPVIGPHVSRGGVCQRL